MSQSIPTERLLTARESVSQHSPDSRIVRSWTRCVDRYGLDPLQPHRTPVVEHQCLREHQERLADLLDIARPEMQRLYQHIAGSEFAVLLTDRDGMILDWVSDAAFITPFTRAGLWLGAVWSEQHEGTNGIGTCLAEQQPVTVHRDEHFRSCHVDLSCSATPIFDPYGETSAILDISSVSCSDSRQSQHHTLALALLAARLIENGYFLRQCRGHWILRFHHRPEGVGLLNEGMLAFDAEGRVVAANQGTVQQFDGLPVRQFIGQPLDAIFDVNVAALLAGDGRQPDDLRLLRDRHGGAVFSMLRAPATARRHREVLTPPAAPPPMSLDGLRGQDPRMDRNVYCAQRVMDKNINILLCGETGVGKEAFAKAIHDASARAAHPFVAVNCAAIPESLIESELFGYKHGAFTGARRQGMRGRILQSDGGTLFLDEIGDMPASLQTRLLRVLEEKTVVPLGDETAVPVDLHVISATHRPLPELVAEGIFREDLYYRLNGLTLTLPPLRQRADRSAFIHAMLAAESHHEPVGLDEVAFAALNNYAWPGNIRQLRNVLRTAAALCEDDVIRLVDLPPEITEKLNGSWQVPAPVAADDKRHALASAERDALLQVLEQHRWNITSTAAHLRMSRNTLYRKMKKHGIAQPARG